MYTILVTIVVFEVITVILLSRDKSNNSASDFVFPMFLIGLGGILFGYLATIGVDWYAESKVTKEPYPLTCLTEENGACRAYTKHYLSGGNDAYLINTDSSIALIEGSDSVRSIEVIETSGQINPRVEYLIETYKNENIYKWTLIGRYEIDVKLYVPAGTAVELK